MFANRGPCLHTNRRRAVIAAQVVVLSVLLLSMAAISIDVGVLYNTRADLQRAADSAALAGASSYVSDTMMSIRMGTGGDAALSTVISTAKQRGQLFSMRNHTYGAGATAVVGGDMLTGWINLGSSTDSIHTNPAPRDYNAFRVTVRRDDGESGSTNGPVNFFFAPVFGTIFGEVTASAVAVFDDRFSTVSVSPESTGFLPFTVSRDALESELANGGDSYAWDDVNSAVLNTADGIREVRIYPYPLSGAGYEEGDGNFGVLNIGTGNQGVDAEVVQILNGITAADLEMEVGTSDLTFSSNGTPITYDITGSPGLEASLKDAISQIVGDVVGFFVHENVVLSGSNAIYTITTVRYGRVMDIRLTGPPNERGLFLQPVSFVGGEITVDPSAPSTGGLVGRLVLAR